MLEIHAIQDRIMRTGAVDTEIDMLAAIREKLLNSKFTPDEAVRRARNLEHGRKDYH